MTKLLALLLLINIGLLGCGKKSDNGGNPFTGYTLTNEIDQYQLLDTNCQETSPHNTLGSFYIYKWSGYSVTSSYESFSEFKSRPYVYSNNITDITTGDSAKYIERGNNYEGQSTFGDRLKICNYTSDYGRKSIETVALTTVKTLENSFKFHKNFSTGISLSALTVSIHPVVELIEGSKAFYVADNASFSSHSKKVAMYPQSKKAADAGVTPLWEMPMVASHEFGHYVFDQYFPSAYKERAMYKTLFWKDPRSRSVIHNHNIDKGYERKREVNNTLVLDAFNEGFADMFGFYNTNQEQRGFEGADCFKKTRDINSSAFYNNDQKALDEKILTLFLQDSWEDSYATHCADPDYQEIHHVGAIVAYGVNKLWSQTISSATEKGKLLIKWLQTLEKKYSENMDTLSPIRFFQNIIHEALLLVKNGSFTGSQCSVIKEVFPIFNNSNKYCL